MESVGDGISRHRPAPRGQGPAQPAYRSAPSSARSRYRCHSDRASGSFIQEPQDASGLTSERALPGGFAAQSAGSCGQIVSAKSVRPRPASVTCMTPHFDLFGNKKEQFLKSFLRVFLPVIKCSSNGNCNYLKVRKFSLIRAHKNFSS